MTWREQYHQDLEDERWKEKRQEVLDFYHNQCMGCGATGIPLDIHHPKYLTDENGHPLHPWQYRLYQMIPYCRECHQKIHGKEYDFDMDTPRKEIKSQFHKLRGEDLIKEQENITPFGFLVIFLFEEGFPHSERGSRLFETAGQILSEIGVIPDSFMKSVWQYLNDPLGTTKNKDIDDYIHRLKERIKAKQHLLSKGLQVHYSDRQATNKIYRLVYDIKIQEVESILKSIRKTLEVADAKEDKASFLLLLEQFQDIQKQRNELYKKRATCEV